MYSAFESHVKKNSLFTKSHKLILAISGGLDSVVLANLLKEGEYHFMLAHANFKLRDKDSEADEKFCKALAKKNNIPIYTTHLDVKSYSQQKKIGTQEAAREMRYQWFHTLLTETKADFILTAHHANDVIETQLLNMIRGTGINGLKGIPEKNGKIIRPLLTFEKEELLQYADKKGIKYRTDKSNLQDKYKRNYLRLHVIPHLKKLNPSLESTFINNSVHFREESEIVNDYLGSILNKLVINTSNGLKLNKKKLLHEKYPAALLHFLLKEFGFNNSHEKSILQNLKQNALSGKVLYSATHRVYIDREDLLIETIKVNKSSNFTFHSLDELRNSKFFRFEVKKHFVVPQKNELYLTESKLIYPLTVRYKKTGDKFKPFGMKGFKLLSDFIKSEKMSIEQKENCKLLVNGNNEIIWVIAHRSDDRYKVVPNTGTFIKLSYHD